jgi:hypothetical protein
VKRLDQLGWTEGRNIRIEVRWATLPRAVRFPSWHGTVAINIEFFCQPSRV